MSRLSILRLRAVVFVFCCSMSTFGVVIFLLHLPFRIMSFLVAGRQPKPPPKVEIITHEAAALHDTPRDTIVLIHGFPDSPPMFDANVAHLTAQGYRCLVVALPGSRGEPVSVALGPNETTELIRRALSEVHDGPVTVIGHDWGAIYTLILQQMYPDMVRRAVLLDVGRYSKQDLSVWIAMLSYQLMLALMYLLGHPAGTIGVKRFMRFAKYKGRALEELTADMCYPYFGALQVLLGKTGRLGISARANGSVPHLFLYGAKKNYMFHDDKWIDFVRSTPCGKVVGMPCHHWVSVELEKECNLLITQWLEESEAVVNKAGSEAKSSSS